MQDILIRQAHPKDAEALLAYLKQAGGESDNLTFGSEGLPFTVEQERAFLQAQQQNPRALFLCAWDGDRLVGSCSMQPLPRRMAHRAEFGISVAKDHWGRGIASAMLERMIDHAKANGFALLNLDVRSDNTRAIRLYEKFGFRVIGTSPAFLKVGEEYADCLLMYLDLR